MDLLAQPPFRADAEAVAHDQHADHQFWIDRRSAYGAVERLHPASARRVRQTDQSLAAGAFPAHAVRARTRRTTRLVGLSAPPSSTAPQPSRFAKTTQL